MTDQHFTPAWLANRLAMIIPEDFSGSVMDPTSGDGALLRAVAALRPQTRNFLATDMDPKVFQGLRKTNPGWLFGRVDVFKRRSRQASRVWAHARFSRPDYVVCNPPFSYRAKKGQVVEYSSRIGVASPAATVCATILEELTPKEALLAVLPSSTLRSEIDAWLWEEIRIAWDVCILETLPRTTFPGVRAQTILVRVSPKIRMDTGQSPKNVALISSGCRCILLNRGKLQMHVAKNESGTAGAPVIHTTNLGGGAVGRINFRSEHTSAMSGAAMLIPRVGEPKRDKFCLFESKETYVLSDCVLSIQGLTAASTRRIFVEITDQAVELMSLYHGTGAPYVTLSRIGEFLKNRGFYLVPQGTMMCVCMSSLPECELAATA